MFCATCGAEIEEDWKYCPECGATLKRRKEILERFPSFMEFGSIFDDVDKEFKRMENMFRSVKAPEEIEREDKISRKPFREGGVSIRISSELGKEPKIEVKTFGDYKEHEPDIRKRLGVEEVPRIERAPPKVTKEPKTKVERKDNKLIFRIKVPGVKSEEDVEIRRMEESIEVRAYAKDKAYFTLFSIPPRATILSKKLEKEEIIIEVEE